MKKIGKGGCGLQLKYSNVLQKRIYYGTEFFYSTDSMIYYRCGGGGSPRILSLRPTSLHYYNDEPVVISPHLTLARIVMLCGLPMLKNQYKMRATGA
jgi:hypothetical protein